MNKELIKKDSGLSKLKRLCKEQAWLVFLLAPLLLVATLAGQNHQVDKRSSSNASTTTAKAKKYVAAATTTATAAAVAAVVAEISSIELASIVARPISELLAMDVYFDGQKGSRNRTRVSSLEIAEEIKHAIDNQPLANVYTRHALVEEAFHNETGRYKAPKVKEHS